MNNSTIWNTIYDEKVANNFLQIAYMSNVWEEIALFYDPLIYFVTKKVLVIKSNINEPLYIIGISVA